MRFYGFHLKHRSHPGMVYSFLPAIAEAYDLDEEGRAWLVWLNGNTQNAVTSLLLLEAAPRPENWRDAVAFWNNHFKALEWDTDRRHQKAKFGEATEAWWLSEGRDGASTGWFVAADHEGWDRVWKYAKGHPHMGRLSAWSMTEYARILLPGIPDAATLMLEDASGSRSHRNGLGLLAGYDSLYWDAGDASLLGVVPDLAALGEDLLTEAKRRFYVLGQDYLTTGTDWDDIPHPDISRLTLESALCTWKSWHKPNRRYPNCYADMMYNRIKKAEHRFGRALPLLWETRQRDLPEYLRLEDNPYDPGLVPLKQNHYLETGCPVMMNREYDDMDDGFLSSFDFLPPRKDPSW